MNPPEKLYFYDDGSRKHPIVNTFSKVYQEPLWHVFRGAGVVTDEFNRDGSRLLLTSAVTSRGCHAFCENIRYNPFSPYEMITIKCRVYASIRADGVTISISSSYYVYRVKGNNPVGGSLGHFGYALNNIGVGFVAIEVDSWQNNADPNNNHIAVVIDDFINVYPLSNPPNPHIVWRTYGGFDSEREFLIRGRCGRVHVLVRGLREFISTLFWNECNDNRGHFRSSMKACYDGPNVSVTGTTGGFAGIRYIKKFSLRINKYNPGKETRVMKVM